MNRTLVHDTPFALRGAKLEGLEPCGFEDGLLRSKAAKARLTSPVLDALFPFRELNLSVNASLPAGAAVSAEVRAREKGRWSPWLAAGGFDAKGGSSPASGGPVDVDTLVLERPADAFQYRLSFSGRGAVLTLVAAAYGDGRLLPPTPPTRAVLLDVPPRSQMVEDESIRRDVCSPASLGMALDFLTGRAEPTRELAARVRDRSNGIFGNWFLNTAFAGRRVDAFVARLNSLAELEAELAAGRPVVCTIAFGEGELAGAPIPRTRGHLVVVRGVDAAGDVVVNDPAAPDEASVRRTYRRSQFERAWLGRKKGVAYLLSPRFPKPLAVAAAGAELMREPAASTGPRDLNRESTLLLGEPVLCLGGKGRWARVRALEQRRSGRPYEGWVRADELARPAGPPDRVVTAAFSKAGGLRLPAGALVVDAGAASGTRRVLLPGDRQAAVPASSLGRLGAPVRSPRSMILRTARLFLGEPYYWGGVATRRVLNGLDCSGLVTVSYRLAGLKLPRNAHDQWVESIPVQTPRPGDLVFLSEEGRPDRVTHVMIWAGRGRVIEAEGGSGKVREVAFAARVSPGRQVYFGTYLAGAR